MFPNDIIEDSYQISDIPFFITDEYYICFIEIKT